MYDDFLCNKFTATFYKYYEPGLRIIETIKRQRKRNRQLFFRM
jgi:hypothetical protein